MYVCMYIHIYIYIYIYTHTHTYTYTHEGQWKEDGCGGGKEANSKGQWMFVSEGWMDGWWVGNERGRKREGGKERETGRVCTMSGGNKRLLTWYPHCPLGFLDHCKTRV